MTTKNCLTWLENLLLKFNLVFVNKKLILATSISQFLRVDYQRYKIIYKINGLALLPFISMNDETLYFGNNPYIENLITKLDQENKVTYKGKWKGTNIWNNIQ